MSFAVEPKTVENTELFAVSLRGDREAFAEIVRRHQNMVTAVTFSVTGNLQQSEDLAQETFIAAWQSLSELREPAKLPAWLCGIARNLSRKWLRKTESERHSRSETSIEDIPEAFADETNRKEQVALLWSTIRSIPEPYREPLVMYYRQEQSVREIAAALELSEDNVRQRIARGRKMLKAEVEKQIESVLQSTRPDTAFTMAVLASLPLAATASGCTIVGTGTTGTSQAGWLWTPFLWLFMPIILITGGFMGLWTALKHSPTVRTRRFMCRAALQWYVFLWVFMLCKLYFDNKHGGWSENGGLFFSGFFVILIGFCIRLVYRWRTLLEEDAGLRPMPEKPLESSTSSMLKLRCWYWLSLPPILGLSLLLLFDIMSELRRDPFFGTFSSLWQNAFLTAVCILWMSIPIGFFFVVGYGIRTARDADSLRRWSPRNGKAFLPTADEATHWPSFWFDLLLMPVLAIVPYIFSIVLGLTMGGVAAWALISTMMMVVATMIASHSAGIPDKRLGGYARLLFFMGICYTVLLSGKGTYLSPQILFGLVYFGAALTAYLIAWRKKRLSEREA